MSTIDQERAKHALSKVKEIEESDDGKFLSYVNAFPANVVNSGLGQACATLLAQDKGKNGAHRKLYDCVEAWLCGTHTASPYHGKKDLIAAIIEGSQDDYVAAQSETMAYLGWLKKFSRAFLQDGGRE